MRADLVGTRTPGAPATLCLLAVLLSLTGCALAPGMHVDVEDRGDAAFRVLPVNAAVIGELRRLEAHRRESAMAFRLPAQDPARAMREYRVGPGDVIGVTVWDHPELNHDQGERRRASDGAEIGPDGRVFFPYVGLVDVGGKTVGEIRQTLTDRLGTVMRAPQLDIRVLGYRAQRVHVTGEVANPGLVALDNTAKGLLEALGERGGLSERASRRHVYLSRGRQRYEIDLAALYGGESGSISPVLEPGDVIRVPDTAEDQVVVLGAVEQPRSVPIAADTLSAIAAITEAGGVTRNTARGSSVYVFRGPGGEGRASDASIQVFQIDLQRPEGVLHATNFPLRPRDVVYVATTGLSKFNSVMQQLLPTLQEIFYIDRLTDGNR